MCDDTTQKLDRKTTKTDKHVCRRDVLRVVGRVYYIDVQDCTAPLQNIHYVATTVSFRNVNNRRPQTSNLNRRALFLNLILVVLLKETKVWRTM